MGHKTFTGQIEITNHNLKTQRHREVRKLPPWRSKMPGPRREFKSQRLKVKNTSESPLSKAEGHRVKGNGRMGSATGKKGIALTG